MNNALPNLVFSDEKGKIFVHPRLKMLGMSARDIIAPSSDEIIPLPRESPLLYLPGHVALGLDDAGGELEVFDQYKNKKIYPVAAMLIPGFTRLLLPAADKMKKKLILPQWSYAAVGWQGGRFVVAATKIDKLIRQRPYFYQNASLLKRNIGRCIKKLPRNRLFKHLINCALHYNCRAAQNLFFGRWEAPLPISPVCNARCIGCLSLQDSDCCVASHSRIDFVPTADEIAQVAIGHLKNAREAMVSFGQGCEGEPLLQFETIKESIIKMRRATRRGTIHLNTNAFNPEYLKELAAIGLDSVRISINSFQEKFYDAYYRPKGYRLNDVFDSIKVSKKSGLFVSVNLLVFPGLTDTSIEVKALIKFLKKGYIDLVQMRNLNIDSHLYLNRIPKIKHRSIGVLPMLRAIKSQIPRVRFGYFNLPRERFKI